MRKWAQRILVLTLILAGLLALPGQFALADCQVRSTTTGGHDIVVCSTDPPDTNGIYTGPGDDNLTIEAGAMVSGYTTAEGDAVAVNTGAGSDTVTNHGTVNGTWDGVALRSGANDTLYNHGSI